MFNINKKKPQANIQHTIRFDEDLHEKINHLTEKEGVSFNHLVLECCRYALDDYPEEKQESDNKMTE